MRLLNPNLCEGVRERLPCTVKFARKSARCGFRAIRRVCVRHLGFATTPETRFTRKECAGARLAATTRLRLRGRVRHADAHLHRTAGGEVVELQWKKSAHSAQYAWWFAIVGRVVSADLVELVFPQYGTSAKSALTHASAIHRTRSTEMHGGLAGGVRKVGAAEVAQWWMALASEEFDRVLKQEQSWDCTAARAARAARAAAAATATLEPQPLEPVTRNAWQYVSDLIRIREVFKKHLPKERDPSLDGDCRRVGGGDRSSRAAHRGVGAARGPADKGTAGCSTR